MSPSQKENQSEQTDFRLSVERGCYLGGPDTGCAGPGGPSGKQQARFYHRKGEEDQQEASQQEVDCGRHQQREARIQVTNDVTNDGDRPYFRARSTRLFRALCFSSAL